MKVVELVHLSRMKKKKTNTSGAACFIIVNFPEDAAETICCSIDLLIFALRSWERFLQLSIQPPGRNTATLWTEACFTSAGFLGAIYFLPFFKFVAALVGRRGALLCSPLVLPCTMV